MCGRSLVCVWVVVAALATVDARELMAEAVAKPAVFSGKLRRRNGGPVAGGFRVEELGKRVGEGLSR